MKGLSDAGDAGDARDAGTPRCCDAGDAGDAGQVCEDAEDVGGDADHSPTVRFAQYLQGFLSRATWNQKPVARPGRSGMLWGPSV